MMGTPSLWRRLIAWLRLEDYEDAKRGRHPGWMTRAELDTLSAEGDRAMRDLGRRFPVVATKLPWWRRLLCWGWCPCRHYEDVGGCGGQCIRCGKIVGYVTRAKLRAYADRSVPR